jgi:hypothetical protein
MEFMMNHLKMLEGEISTWTDVSVNSHRWVRSEERSQACPVATIIPALLTEGRD